MLADCQMTVPSLSHLFHNYILITLNIFSPTAANIVEPVYSSQMFVTMIIQYRMHGAKGYS